MKQILLFFFLFVALSCTAQSVEKRYSSSMGNSGTITFFRPMKLKKKVNMEKFVYDMTYVTSSDSLILNLTANIFVPQNIVKLTLGAGEFKFSDPTPELIYRDVKNKSYELRISTKFRFGDIEKLFKQSTPMVFMMTLSDGTECSAVYKKSKWKKERVVVDKIIQSIKL